jgi:hypothetical protein
MRYAKMTHPVVFLVIHLATVCLVPAVHAWENPQAPQTIEQCRLFIEQADHSSIAGWAFESYFQEKTNEQLAAASCDESTTLALMARWQMLSREYPLKEANERFVQFFEGRTRVLVPQEWTISNQSRFRRGDDETEFTKQLDLIPDLYAQTHCNVARDGEHLSFRYHGEEFKVTIAEFEKVKYIERGNFDRIRIDKIDDAYIITIFCSDRDSSCLMSVSNDRITWSQRLWATGWGIRSTTGPGAQFFTKTVISADSVTLFGFGSDTYVESFELKTGKPLFRYHQDAWNWKTHFPRQIAENHQRIKEQFPDAFRLGEK